MFSPRGLQNMRRSHDAQQHSGVLCVVDALHQHPAPVRTCLDRRVSATDSAITKITKVAAFSADGAQRIRVAVRAQDATDERLFLGIALQAV